MAHAVNIKRKKILFDVKTGRFFGKKVQIPAKAARPFLRPAIDSQKEAAIARIGAYMGPRIEQEASK